VELAFPRAAKLPVDDRAVQDAQSRAKTRLEHMLRYARSLTCRRHALLTYFGEETAARCGACDVCLGRHDPDAVTPDEEPLLRRILEQAHASIPREEWFDDPPVPAHRIDELGDYYGAILEHSFIIIEHTFQGYLLAMTGTDAAELRNHTSPYEFAKGQVPLEDETIDSLKALYDARRTEHYYGTTVTTKLQAETMRSVARELHEHVVRFDHEIEQFCLCESH
jgi:hypothetical protein